MLCTEVLKVRRGVDLGRKIKNWVLDVLSLMPIRMNHIVSLVSGKTVLKVSVLEEEPGRKLKKNLHAKEQKNQERVV